MQNLLVHACLAAVVLLAADDAATKNQGLAPKGGRFTIQMPGKADEQISKMHTFVGPIDLHLFIFSPDSNTAYMASYGDYPEEIIKNSNSDKMLNGSRDGIVKSINGKLDREKKITIDKHPGRDITIVTDKAAVHERLYLVNCRLYQLVVASTSKEFVAGKDAEKFLDSYKLTDK